ncbi:type II toxin-antitoxin system mRNA interferase toxin, RelE/StbE family [Candidatus Woesearchaeota archaeon]|nr:MAG: type II toxin-antitoxin system mRNA interferase toxin, RelE/StbE family [Candidatus Woesearchaeota archaeon]
MAYSLEVAEGLEKRFQKLVRRDGVLVGALKKKVAEILENLHHFKPLRAPMQNMRRVHVGGSFVLIFSIDETKGVVRLLEFEHHDNAYR